MLSLSTTIVASTMDLPFIRHCVREVAPFSEFVSVAYYDCLFNGEPENPDDLRKINNLVYRGMKEYDPDEGEMSSIVTRPEFHPEDSVRAKYMRLRVAAFQAIDSRHQSEYTLIIDADEIVDPVNFKYWIENEQRRPGYFLVPNWWYFREPTLQADNIERIACITKSSLIREAIDNDGEETFLERDHRPGFYLGERANIWPEVLHHYSWVRTKEEMLKKCRTWSHKDDAPWERLIEEEFSRDFNGRDFIHAYSYKNTENQFGIDINDSSKW